DVCITNFSSSWTNGNALIALLHSFLPDQINYDQLSENNVEIKFRTAFSIAEQQGIKTTLDLEDILHSERPSWEPIMDYITEIFRRFGYHNMLPNVSSSSSSINSPQNVTTENAIVEDISSTNEDSSAASINNMFDQHPQQHQQTQQTFIVHVYFTNEAMNQHVIARTTSFSKPLRDNGLEKGRLRSSDENSKW
ncbi:hypothetical protein GJ496_005042, partial [Pomphorhynchus laevis]